jgi:formylglycine-generating enzyme
MIAKRGSAAPVHEALALLGVASALGCSAILGIGDPPRPRGPDAGNADASPPNGEGAERPGDATPVTIGGPPPPSCAGLPATCGAANNEDCCTSLRVPDYPAMRGTFTLGRGAGQPDDLACEDGGAFADMCPADEVPGVPATVHALWLDKFEVTVGRMRRFVTSGFKPSPGDGRHGYVNGGTEPGWQGTWTVPGDVAAWNALLQCDSTFQTWTPEPAANETKPINCLDWYAAYAFCIWDGGFLPTEAEWEFAASGGEERVFPWSTPPVDTTYGSQYACYLPECVEPQPVGTFPPGAGRWGHADLAGNVSEWVLDAHAPYPAGGCNDCANLSSGVERVDRGGIIASQMRATFRSADLPSNNDPDYGVRCARRGP